MPKDKRSCTVSNKSHGFLYKPYSRGKSSGAVEEEASAELENVTCPICMESPHNAVLLLCNSVDKGCRPFICDTSHRHSNCLDQYIKAQAKSQAADTDTGNFTGLRRLVEPAGGASNGSGGNSNGNGADGFRGRETCKGLDLLCPLCRGRVSGWKVVDRIRQQLNTKKRGCAQDSCSFAGVYEELRKHARCVHPLARPSEVDPARQREWWRMESQRDLGDVFSTIHSAMPGATIVGDYVIEEGDDEDVHDDDEDEDEDGFDDGPGEQPVAVDVSRDWWTMLVLFQIPSGASAAGTTSAPPVNHGQAQGHHHSSHHHHHQSNSQQQQQQQQQQHSLSGSRSSNSSRSSYNTGRRSSLALNVASSSSRRSSSAWGEAGASSSGGRASLERSSHRGSSSQRRHRSSSTRR